MQHQDKMQHAMIFKVDRKCKTFILSVSTGEMGASD